MPIRLRHVCAALLLFAGAAEAGPRFVATGNADLAYESITLPRYGIDYPTATSEVFVAQARIGNRATNGDYEIGLHVRQPNPSVFPTNTPPVGDATERQFAWGNGTAYAFSLSRSGDTIAFALGNYSESWTNDAVSEVNAISFRARGSSTHVTTLTDLTYAGGGPAQALRSFTSTGSTGPDLALFGALAGDFTLTGTLTFTWTGTPNGSSLAMQLKGLEGFTVPEPTAAALLLAGLGCLLATRRARRG
ncbi:choice-of-anchor W domain-containing protein [Roseomonas sp. AR75]|uniref:choice-of-anchor W domain-containing protein n=1 Tax=Roseomonas sp. AR75 TaxID=2562311 RepID=UPI0010C052F2|nr:choice-of-anchor W domain-containing protein [Roseomonas sp. AR75]